MHPDVFVDVGLISIASALAGARVLHLALLPAPVASWRDAFNLSDGLSMYGGVVAAIGACWLYARWRRIPSPANVAQVTSALLVSGTITLKSRISVAGSGLPTS